MARARVVSVLFAGLSLAGCAWLPAAGPTAHGVIAQSNEDGRQRFTMVDVDYPIVAALQKQLPPSLDALFGADALPPPQTIAVGDSIVVFIWEANGGSLFGASPSVTNIITSPSSANAPQTTVSAQVSIPEQVVLTDGTIKIPFAGRIPVVGRTPQQVEDQIRQSLVRKATEPQVVVVVTKTAFYAVSVNGDAVTGMRLPLSPKGDRILDAVSEAGGIKTPALAYETDVHLTRNGVTGTIPFARLVKNPRENIYLWPGDVLTVDNQPRYVEVFGATNQNAEISFDGDAMNVAQAVAKASGLMDQRADASGVFLLRFEPRALVASFGQVPADVAGDLVPTVYQFDFNDMQSYFLAQNFQLRPGDVIYVANYRAESVQKFFQLFGTITTPVITGSQLSTAVH